ATVVPGPRAPQGTAMSPRSPRSADCRSVQPRCRRIGTPMVTPMPNPVTDSAKGTMPKTTRATPRGRLGESDSTQAEICDIEPAAASSRARTMPKSRMSATSRMRGKYSTPESTSTEAGVGKARTTMTAAATAQARAAIHELCLSRSNTMAMRNGERASTAASEFLCAILFYYSSIVYDAPMAKEEELGARVFGARIRARRNSNALTLNELAVRAGLSRAALSKIERGEQDASVSNAMGLSRALGVEVGELLAAPEVTITRSEAIPTSSDYGHGVRRRDLPSAIENMDVVHYRLD